MLTLQVTVSMSFVSCHSSKNLIISKSLVKKDKLPRTRAPPVIMNNSQRSVLLNFQTKSPYQPITHLQRQQPSSVLGGDLPRPMPLKLKHRTNSSSSSREILGRTPIVRTLSSQTRCGRQTSLVASALGLKMRSIGVHGVSHRTVIQRETAPLTIKTIRRQPRKRTANLKRSRSYRR